MERGISKANKDNICSTKGDSSRWLFLVDSSQVYLPKWGLI